jgi:glutaminase
VSAASRPATAFNSIVQLEHEGGIPRNPFINAGAIAITDVVLAGHTPKEAIGDIVRFLRYLAGNEDDIIIDQDGRAARRQATGFRNFALANFMKLLRQASTMRPETGARCLFPSVRAGNELPRSSRRAGLLPRRGQPAPIR